jgi:DNA-directed RNA polymerase specialized sigma24 family protein
MDGAPGQVTQILEAVGAGDERAAERLLPLVYEELRRLAAARMANEPPGQTLQPAALVHEAWLRLVGSGQEHWNSRGHFFGAAAEAMRRILVERARKKARVRHGGGLERVDLAMMDHPNIAKVLDTGATETGRPALLPRGHWELTCALCRSEERAMKCQTGERGSQAAGFARNHSSGQRDYAPAISRLSGPKQRPPRQRSPAVPRPRPDLLPVLAKLLKSGAGGVRAPAWTRGPTRDFRLQFPALQAACRRRGRNQEAEAAGP